MVFSCSDDGIDNPGYVTDELYEEAQGEIKERNEHISRLQNQIIGLKGTLRLTNRVRLVFDRALQEVAGMEGTCEMTDHEFARRCLEEIIPNAQAQAKSLMPKLGPKASENGESK